MVEAWRDGDGSAGGDEAVPAFERGAHGAGVDEEGLRSGIGFSGRAGRGSSGRL